MLANTDTVRIRSREPAQAAAEAIVVASPASREERSSRDLAQQGPSADHASTAPVIQKLAAGDGRAANSDAVDSTAPPYSATAGSLDDNGRTRLPTARRGSDTAHYDSLVAVGAIDSPRKPRSRHGSAAPAESPPFVTVRFPPPDAVAGRLNLASPTSQANTSNTTLAGAFGFSPRRRRVQSDETAQLQDKVMPITPELDQEYKTLTSCATISPRGDLPEQCGEQAVSSAGLALRQQKWTHHE